MFSLPIKNRDKEYPVQPTKIIALGLNYADHVEESASVRLKNPEDRIPKEPVLFPKTPNTLLPPGETIIIPAFLKGYDFKNPRVDYEAELALIIKDRCKNIPPEKAEEHIYGFTCLNDVSQRNLQHGDISGWFRGKSLDTFAPIGPVIVLMEEIKHYQNLEITCRLNGEVVQHSNTSKMIFSIPYIISFISRIFTLEAGDIITTGTPSGVGPLKDGDTVEVEIQDIGVLKNSVKNEPDT